MSVVKNLMFQKQNYPEIYNGYLLSYINEDMVEKEISNTETIESDSGNVILLIVNEFISVLKDAFVIPKNIYDNELINIDDYEEINIYRTYKDEVTININDSGIDIYCMHPYHFAKSTIKLVKNANKKVCKNINKVYAMRDLSMYEKIYLKNDFDKIIFVNSTNELVENFINIKNYYNEADLIHALRNCGKKNLEVESTFTENYYKVSLSLDIIRNIIDMNLMEKEIHIISQYIYSTVVNEYKNEAKKIIEPYLNEDFINNYGVIENFFQVGEKLFKEIASLIKVEIHDEIQSFKNLDCKSDLYIELLGSSIKKIDAILSNSLDKLSKSMNII